MGIPKCFDFQFKLNPFDDIITTSRTNEQMNPIDEKEHIMNLNMIPTSDDESLGRCSSLSIYHLLSLQSSLVDDLYYQKRRVRRLQAKVAELERRLKESQTVKLADDHPD